MQEELTVQLETPEEKKARVLARMKSQQTGTKQEARKTTGDNRRINEYYGKRAEYYTDSMTLEEMKDVDMDTLKGTDRAAFIDVLLYKLGEEAKIKEDASVEGQEESSVTEEENTIS